MRTVPKVMQVPLNIVGSNKFGRYPKGSQEQTFNMIISDDSLVDYAGYEVAVPISPGGVGRGIYSSTRFGHMIVVIDDNVYLVNENMAYSLVGVLDTYAGDVFIDENNNSQIAICDKQNIYIFNYVTNGFAKAKESPGNALDFLPGYITYQNGYLIAPDLRQAVWRLSESGDGTLWPSDAQHTGLLQTKPDLAVATVRAPGRGNLLYVFGETVTELWTDTGAQLFPYERNTSINIDYGCLNQATIASLESIIVWLAANEKSGPAIMMSTGGEVKKISNDGIDFKLAQLTNPSDAYGFLFRQDGHLLYQITFPTDNLSYVYDFNTSMFFTLCDYEMNYHVARRVAFFHDNYYFVSLKDGYVYRMSSNITTYAGAEIPRIRVCSGFRLPDQSNFVVNNLGFTLEQGTSADIQRVDLSVSRDGGEHFGNSYGVQMNALGNRMNKLMYWNLGYANDFTPQFRFWGQGRFVAFNGLMEISQ